MLIYLIYQNFRKIAMAYLFFSLKKEQKRLGQKSFGFKKKQRFYAVAFCMVAIDLVK